MRLTAAAATSKRRDDGPGQEKHHAPPARPGHSSLVVQQPLQTLCVTLASREGFGTLIKMSQNHCVRIAQQQ